MALEEHEFDIAVSFAGEQRTYVEAYVDACRERRLTVFYDRNQNILLWGRNFITEFRKVYGRSRTKHFVPFISREYLSKSYPLDELQAAIAEQVRRGPGQGYILPVRMDDVEIPPELISPAIGYQDGRAVTPEQLADITVERLEGLHLPGASESHATPPDATMFALPRIAPRRFSALEELEHALTELAARFRQAVPRLESFGYRGQVRLGESGINVQIERDNRRVCELRVWIDDQAFGSDRVLFAFAWPRVSGNGYNGWIESTWNSSRGAADFELTDMSLAGGRLSQQMSLEQLFGAFWSKIVTFIEQTHR